MNRQAMRGLLGLMLGLLAACAGPQSEVEKQEQAQAAYDIGLGALAEGNMAKAVSELQKAVEQEPRNARYWHALGNARLRADENTKAVEAFRRAVELDARFSDAYNDLGVSYIRLQQWDLAIDAFRKALANPQYLNPERAHINLGNTYMTQGRYVLAADEFRRVADVMPQSPDGFFLWGRALRAQGKLPEAKEQIEKAIKMNGTVAVFHLEMGMVLVELGDKAQAREHLQRAIDLNPATQEATEARRRLQELK
jgi:Tfp pilus assembly protein PilF